VEVVQAALSGRFRIPEIKLTSLVGVERDVFAYHSGYEPIDQESLGDKTLLMRPFTGTDDERVKSHRIYDSLRGCGPAEEAVRKLRPLYQAIDEEAANLKVSNPKKNPPGGFVQGLRYLEESISREKMREQQKDRANK
jgi:hypothetical protein